MMGAWLACLFALLTVGVELGGVAPGGPGLSLAIAALIAAYRCSGVLASLLGLMALGVSLQDGSSALLTPLMWSAHVAMGGAIGALARHIEPQVVRLSRVTPLAMLLALSFIAAFVLLLPDELVHFMDAQGEALSLSVRISEPEFATERALLIPAILSFPAPLAAWSDLSLWFALGSSVVIILAMLLEGKRVRRFTHAVVLLLALALVVPALADWVQLATSDPIALPSPEALIVEIGWLSGGVTGLNLNPAPSHAELSLASRPITSLLRFLVGLSMLVVLWGGFKGRHQGEEVHASLSWGLLAILSALVAWMSATAFVSVSRVEAIAPWGAHPMAYSAVAGAIIAFSAIMGGLFSERSHRWSVWVQILALIVWCTGLLAPSAGWLST